MSSNPRYLRGFLVFIACIALLLVLYSVFDPYKIMEKLGLAMLTVQSVLKTWKDVEHLLDIRDE